MGDNTLQLEAKKQQKIQEEAKLKNIFKKEKKKVEEEEQRKMFEKYKQGSNY